VKSKIGLSLDLSGSISKKELISFLQEIKNLFSQYPHMEILLYGCDSIIQGKTWINGKNGFKQKTIEQILIGGGGTSHIPIFKDIYIEKEPIKALFCFTDGYSDINSIPEQYKGINKFKTFWILPKTSAELKFNFGKNVIIENEK
jgi:predicted metal-dependent peptidase